MKVEKTQNPFIFLAIYCNLSLKSGDLDFSSWRIWAIFFIKNPFYRSKSFFWWNFTPKNNSLHLDSPNHELCFFFFFFSSEPIDFLSKMVPCKFSLNLPLFGLKPTSKARGSNLWLSTNRIALFQWTLDLGPSFKVALSSSESSASDTIYQSGW